MSAYKGLHWMRRHKEPAPKLERVCRSCGCTEDNACVHLQTGVTCHWFQWDLCSACAGGSALREQYRLPLSQRRQA